MKIINKISFFADNRNGGDLLLGVFNRGIGTRCFQKRNTVF